MFMNRTCRKNFRILKKYIDYYVNNEELLEKSYILLVDINKIDIQNNIKLAIHNKVIDVINFECYSKLMDKSVTFSFDRDRKEYYIRVKYPDYEEYIEVYKNDNDIIITKCKKTNNTQNYLSISKYVDNKLNVFTEVINLDFNDPSLKKNTSIRFNSNKGDKKVTITYDKQPITEECYKVDYLDSDLSYNNKNSNDNYRYTQKLVSKKEFMDCKDNLNKKVLTRK